MADPIILGTGLITPLGLGVAEHAFYARASVAAPPPAAFEKKDGERIEVLHCGFLGASLAMGERLSRLAELALHQTLVSWSLAGGPSGVALAFIGPSRAGVDPAAVAAARDRAAKRVNATVVQTWTGAAGAFSALAQARVWLDGGEIPAVLVVAVDSYISVEALSDFLEREDSVFCPRTKPPAEGAAALLLTTRERARAFGLEGASVLATGTALGQGNDDDDAILDGRALTSLVESLPVARIDLVTGQELVDDLRTRDWFLAYARTGKKFVDPATLVTLEEETGRLGAAAGLAALVFGVGQLRHHIHPGCAPDATFLAWAISPDGTRGVALARGGEAAAMVAAHGTPRVSAVDPAARERLGAMNVAEEAEIERAAPEDEPDAGADALSAIIDLSKGLLGAANDDLPELNAERVSEGAGSPGAAAISVRLREGQGEPVSLATTYGEIAAACLDGIALAACHRMTLRRDAREREEERILAFTDALLVTPRFMSCLARWWEESADLPDPWKVWAPVFALGCLHGDDIAEGLGHVLRAVPEDEAETAVIAGDALAIAPHPDRLKWAAALAKDPHPCARAAALSARSELGALPVDALLDVLAKSGSRTMRWAAVRAAARAAEDRRLDEMLVAEVHRAVDADFLWEVLRALALRGHATGYHAMRHDPALLSRLGGRALSVLAFFGDAADATLARAVVTRCGLTTAVISGLGRYGHPGAAPILLRALGDEDHADDASDALVWIFGMAVDENEVTSPEAWKQWLHTTRFPEDTRLRFGKPYSPACVAEAAGEGARSQADIVWMVDEAHVRCGVRRAASLSQWSPIADAALAPLLSTLTSEAAPFAADPWRSVTRSLRRFQ